MTSQHISYHQEAKKRAFIAKLDALGYTRPIKDNLMMLQMRTCRLNDLATRFVETQLLSLIEKTKIMQYGGPEVMKVEQLFVAVMKRGSWRKVIDALEKTGNTHIVWKLRDYVNTGLPPEIKRPDGINAQIHQNNLNHKENINSFHEMQLLIFPTTEDHSRGGTCGGGYFVQKLSRNGTPCFAIAALCLMTVLWTFITLSPPPMHVESEASPLQALNTIHPELASTILVNSTSLGYLSRNTLPPQHSTYSKNFTIDDLDDFMIVTIKEPDQLLGLPDNGSKIHLIISPQKAYLWQNLGIFCRIKARVLEFNGLVDPRSVKYILEKLGESVVKIIFSIDNAICQEFFTDNVRPNGSAVHLKMLHKIRFTGDDCGEIYQFVENEINLENVRELEFEKINILPRSVIAIGNILLSARHILEYIRLINVSVCKNCKLFRKVFFPNLKYAKLVLDTGIDSPLNRDVINSFNSAVPQTCLTIHPDNETLIIDCELLKLKQRFT